ncbi:MAG: DUF397 domain-containing protein [Pseudonocardiaceae bacterium]
MPLPAACDTGWFKSSYSDNSSNNCVECRIVGSVAVLVRDSKNPELPPFRFGPDEWSTFVNRAKAGKFDLPS